MLLNRLVRTPYRSSKFLLLRPLASKVIRPQFRGLSTLPRLPIFEALASHDPKSIVVIHSASQRSFTYGDLLHDVALAKANLLENAQGKRLDGERIGFLIENSYDYVGAQTPLCSPLDIVVVKSC
jgi:hypothetical protein